MDIRISKTKEESEVTMDWNDIFGQDNEEEDIYCAKCLQIPKYTIVIGKDENIQLSHKCKGKEEKINFPFDKKHSSYTPLECYYCKNKTSDICLECKNYICEMCQNEHISKPIDENINQYNLIGSKLKEKEDTNYICHDKDIQFFCNEHFIKYQYFCSFCEKNLCIHCKNFHVHIKCQSLFDCAQIKNIKIKQNNSSDEFITNLNKLSQLFENSYNTNYSQNKMNLNILENYTLIEGINTFMNNYKKYKNLKKAKNISSHFLNKEKEEEILCDSFYDDEFKKIYSDLIDQTNNGNYEYHHNLKVLEKFYKNKNKCNAGFNLCENFFIISLKSQIYNFKNIFCTLKLNLLKINTKFRINYLNKEISNLKLLVNHHDFDIHLLKQINMNLLFKYNYQLRRKTGNLIYDVILKNYSDQLETIKENNYILMESIIQIRKKIIESNELEGPEKELRDYQNKLKIKYEELLKLSNDKISSQLEKFEENDFKWDLLDDDDDVDIRIKPNNNDYSKEVTVLNLFFIIKQKYGMIFNDTIHNHTEIVNIQLIDEIKKINENPSNGNDHVKINGNQINGNNKIDIKINNKENKKCTHCYKIFNELKDYFGLDKNCLLEENKNIIELITNPSESETKIDDYKSKLDKIFKNYEIEDSVDFKKASDLYFKGEIKDILKEKRIYHNINKIINEMKQIDLEKIRKEVSVDIEKIEPELNENIIKSENHQFFLFNEIQKVKKYISLDSKKGKINNPFNILENYEKYNLNYFSDESVKNIYMIYLVNLYFCVEQISEYLNILKEKYNDIKILDIQERNIEKNKIIKALDSTINYKEHDTFTEIWNKLKKEDTLDKNNNSLNLKIKEYIRNNNEKTFIKDLNAITKLKNEKIELWKSDPQYLTVKAYWYSKGIPLEIPSNLKRKKILNN